MEKSEDKKFSMRTYDCEMCAENKGDIYEVTFLCNLNGNASYEVEHTFTNPTMELTYDLETIFHEKNSFTFFDAEKNIGVDIGIDRKKDYEIYFSVIDYSHDATLEVKPTIYKLVLDNKYPGATDFNKLLQLTHQDIDKEKRKPKDEPELNRTEHKRASRL